MTDTKMSLLDVMAVQVGATYLSDLHRLNDQQRTQLAQSLEKVAARDEDLFEWNDALMYLAGEEKPRASAEQAKTALLRFLNGGERPS